MKRIFATFIISATLLVSCSSGIKEESKMKVNLTDSIRHYEQMLFSNSSYKIEAEDAIKLADFYEDYAIKNEKDSIAPTYLFKAADINMNMGRSKKALECFSIILEKYPDFDKAPSALFLKAFVYENQLMDYANAEKYYRQFIGNYPDNDFTDDAEISLKNLGKTPEELIKEFENKNK